MENVAPAKPSTPVRKNKFRMFVFKERCRYVCIVYRRHPVSENKEEQKLQQVQFAACIFSGPRDEKNSQVLPLPAGFYSRKQYKEARMRARTSAVERFMRVPRMVAVPLDTDNQVLRFILRACLFTKHGCYGTRNKPGVQPKPKIRSMDRIFKMIRSSTVPLDEQRRSNWEKQAERRLQYIEVVSQA